MRTNAHRQRQPSRGESCELARPCASARRREARTTLRAQRPVVNGAAPRTPRDESQGFEPAPDANAPAHFGHDLSRVPLHSKAPVRIQTKLAVSAPGDGYEEEAERVSEQLMRMPEPRLQRACECGGGCTGCKKERPEREGKTLLRRHTDSSANGGRATALPVVHEVLSEPGRPLDAPTRAFMEPRFGHDLGHVRIHTGRRAAESARAVKALAYTVGRDVVFGEGKFSPHTHAGRRLLAHELVHTLQQGAHGGQAGVLHRQAGELDIALRNPAVRARIAGSETLDGFSLNSPALTAKHVAKLRALASRLKELLRENPSGTVEITGHTDATGEEAYNDKLGRNRADAVAAFLRDAKVPASALHTASAGESSLLVPTDRAEPRNRRVEVRFVPGGPAKTTAETTTETGQETKPPPPPKTTEIPRPESLCAEHPEICDPITTKPETLPSCRPPNCAAVSLERFEKQPPDLRMVLVKSRGTKEDAADWFGRLDTEDRMALAQIYNRLCRYGVWCHVRLVTRVAPGEPPVIIADQIFKVPGATPSVYFITPSWPALFNALMATGRFCRAHGAGASQHPGQITLREISGSDSLHVSIGPGEGFDAHVDRFSPTPEPTGDGLCSNDPTPAAVGHIGRELASEKTHNFMRALRKFARKYVPVFGRVFPDLPGVEVFPEPPTQAPVPPGSVGSDVPPDIIRMTLRGPVKARRPRSDASPLPAAVEQQLAEEIPTHVPANALVPPSAERDYAVAAKAAEDAGPDEERALMAVREAALARLESFAGDAHYFAHDMARRMAGASSGRKQGFAVQLGPSYMKLTPDERKYILERIRDIARVDRALLAERAGGVYKIAVAFGEEVIWEINF